MTSTPNQTAPVAAFDVRGALRACAPHRMDDPSWYQTVADWLNDCISQRIESVKGSTVKIGRRVCWVEGDGTVQLSGDFTAVELRQMTDMMDRSS